MQTDRNEELRKAAAAANLEKRKQQMRRQKRRRQKRLRAFILLGLILALIMLIVIACSVHGRNKQEKKPAESSSAEQAGTGESADESTAEAGADTIVIGLKGSPVQKVLQGDPYIENGAFAVDRRSGAIPEGDIVIKGKVDTSEPGEYKVTYKVKHDGAKASAERTVQVLTEEEFGDKASNVPVMMYHWVYTADDVPDDLDGNWILDTTLEEHLAFLKENGFYYPGWKELRAWVDDEISLPAACTVLTFDDGKEAFLKYGIPVLEKYNIPATSFMIGWEKNDGAEKVKEYASPLIDFESHTYAMHQKVEPLIDGHKGIMASMSKDEIMADLARAAELTGTNDAIAYPYGDYTEDFLDAVREQGIACGFTVEYDRVRKGMDPAKLPRVRVLGDESFQIWKESVY
jgi:peptidoglycan/xylan/chitin deacetylase (PgdA/CDA1 family)